MAAPKPTSYFCAWMRHAELKPVRSVWIHRSRCNCNILTVRPKVVTLTCELKRWHCKMNTHQAELDSDLQLRPVGKNWWTRLCWNSLFNLSHWLIKNVRTAIPSVTTCRLKHNRMLEISTFPFKWKKSCKCNCVFWQVLVHISAFFYFFYFIVAIVNHSVEFWPTETAVVHRIACRSCFIYLSIAELLPVAIPASRKKIWINY